MGAETRTVLAELRAVRDGVAERAAAIEARGRVRLGAILYEQAGIGELAGDLWGLSERLDRLAGVFVAEAHARAAAGEARLVEAMAVALRAAAATPPAGEDRR